MDRSEVRRVYLLAAITAAATAWAVSAQPATDAPRPLHEYNLPADRLAMQGYDPVSYFPEGGGAPLEGKENLTAAHRGVTYRFANEANRSRFTASPEKYEPLYGGWCATAAAKEYKIGIDPSVYRISKNRLLLFYSKRALRAWDEDEPGNEKKANTYWKRLTGEDTQAGTE